MAKIINLTPQERAIKEKQAARKITEKRIPFSQEAIYQEAYGDPNVIFESDFVKPEAKKKLQEYAKGVYDAYGNIRKQVVETPQEAKYQAALGDVFGEEYDPLTRQKLISGVSAYRQGALGSEVGRRFGQYQTERAQTMGEVYGGQRQLASAYEQILKQEEEARREAEKAALRSAARRSSGPKATKVSPYLVNQDGQLLAFDKNNLAAGPYAQYALPQELEGTPTFEDYLSQIQQEQGITLNLGNPTILNDLREQYQGYLVDAGFAAPKNSGLFSGSQVSITPDQNSALDPVTEQLLADLGL